MKIKKLNIIFSCFIIILVSFIVIPVKMDNNDFFPSEGTTSTYQWSFDGIPLISTLNGDHIDHSDHLTYTEIFVENPLSCEFTVKYSMFNEFLEESVSGEFHNETGTSKFKVSYLINTLTRLYVNELGISSNMHTCGYIDPRGLAIGDFIMVGMENFTVGVKENITIFNSERESWKLDFVSEYYNITYYFDIFTGILIDALYSTTSGSIGQGSSINNDIISHRQHLIATNAWISSQTTDIEFIIFFIGFGVLIAIPRRE